MSQFINTESKPFSNIKETQQYCNKHSDKKADYFQLQCPWIKFCEICALNIALCGKKIQKNLNASEMFNKITLTQLLKQMQKGVKDCQTQHGQYSFIIKETESIKDYFGSILTKIQSFIQTLSVYKKQLQKLVYENLTKELMCLFQKQNVLSGKKIQLNKNINRIQCEFTKLLKQSNQTIMNDHIKRCKLKVFECQEVFLGSNFQRQMINKITEVKKNFLIKHSYDQLKPNSNINLEFQDYQIDALNQESTIYFLDNKKHYTQANSTDVSGLVSRAETVNNQTINTLNEFNKNRRNSRTVLQLRSRCNTKSTKKNDRHIIDIDIRQSIKQNVARLKTKN